MIESNAISDFMRTADRMMDKHRTALDRVGLSADQVRSLLSGNSTKANTRSNMINASQHKPSANGRPSTGEWKRVPVGRGGERGQHDAVYYNRQRASHLKIGKHICKELGLTIGSRIELYTRGRDLMVKPAQESGSTLYQDGKTSGYLRTALRALGDELKCDKVIWKHAGNGIFEAISSESGVKTRT